jgi:hypothetical protein
MPDGRRGTCENNHWWPWTFELENCGKLHDKLLPMLKTSTIVQKYSKSE